MFEHSQNPVSVDFPPVSRENDRMLNRFAPIKRQDYHDFKEDFITWLSRKGKRPFRGVGYADSTVRTTHYKIEAVYRWLWRTHGKYTKDLPPTEADEFLDMLMAETPKSDTEIYDYVKSIKRLYKWFSDTRETDIDWEYDHADELVISTEGKSIHYFKQREMAALYEASIELASVKSYHTKSMSPDERDRLKAHLAQRFEKPKAEIGPKDFDRANSWKFPSLVSVSIDCGLRPIEVGRASTRWLNLRDGELVIPKSDATKNTDPWECALSPRSTRALRRWLDERSAYEKYGGRDELWLTKYGNPYGKDSLNPLLGRLLDETEIKPHGRDLSWYAIRRGAATMWANNSGVEDAKEQLRHKALETTMRYVKSESGKRRDIAAGLW